MERAVQWFRRPLSLQVLQVEITDPVLAPSTGMLSVKVQPPWFSVADRQIKTRTDIPAYGGGAFDVRRSSADFDWLQAALAANHVSCIIPPLDSKCFYGCLGGADFHAYIQIYIENLRL